MSIMVATARAGARAADLNSSIGPFEASIPCTASRMATNYVFTAAEWSRMIGVPDRKSADLCSDNAMQWHLRRANEEEAQKPCS